MKICPNCKSELATKVIGSIDVDECNRCGGIWFDRGELKEAEELVDPNLNWLDFEIWKHEHKFDAKSADVLCPSCVVPTGSLTYGETGVEINYCTECHGIWLDKNEFPKIIEELEKELSEKSFADYIHLSIEEAKEVFTGHKSLASEWKDFSTVLRLMEQRLYVEQPKLIERLMALNALNPFK